MLKCILCVFFSTFTLTVAALSYNPWSRQVLDRANTVEFKDYPYQACFEQTAVVTQLPLALLLAVAKAESNFDTRAVSKANAVGVMQIQWPATAQDLGFSNKTQLFDPCANIAAGGEYLKRMHQRYEGDVHLALAAYNYGPGRIAKFSAVNDLPKGANWYSQYVSQHFNRVLSRPQFGGNGSGYLDLITFNQPYRAKAYSEFMDSLLEDISLEWFRLPLQRFVVRAYYKDTDQQLAIRKRLEAMGVLLAY